MLDDTYIDGDLPDDTDTEAAPTGLSEAEQEQLRALLSTAGSQATTPRRKEAPKPPTVQVPRRLKPRKVTHVTFRVEGWSGAFTVPSANHLTQREQQGITRGDMDILKEVFGPVIEAIEDMTNDEVQAFTEAWRDASGVTTGESTAA
ncbi:MAG: hypothetical protein Q4D96_02890 [Propionibacteriaceae bacterium]|nr:hypothetical protein [Propionibacteriaceae bacterium]